MLVRARTSCQQPARVEWGWWQVGTSAVGRRGNCGHMDSMSCGRGATPSQGSHGFRTSFVLAVCARASNLLSLLEFL
eukprot:scaffold150834_cov32-Tisochrysis_lutea.AAC.3